MSLVDIGAAAIAIWMVASILGLPRIVRRAGQVFLVVLGLLMLGCVLAPADIGSSVPVGDILAMAAFVTIVLFMLRVLLAGYLAYRRQRTVVARMLKRPQSRKRRLDRARPGRWP